VSVLLYSREGCEFEAGVLLLIYAKKWSGLSELIQKQPASTVILVSSTSGGLASDLRYPNSIPSSWIYKFAYLVILRFSTSNTRAYATLKD